MNDLTTTQIEVLRWMSVHKSTPASAGANVAGGKVYHFNTSTMSSLEDRGLIEGYLGNDGARWYSLTEEGFEAAGVA